ncbi:MAG: hypothetical protein P9L92_11615 [Candidatus Electryonea clarkiae]|nr:hypothetical protein [Candidatus Electryonea clarkiae]MDP8285633.1 hypothetical protein [Candidatus Electryonea clarkiae]
MKIFTNDSTRSLIFILLLFLLFSNNHANAASARFMLITPGARATGMGDAQVALVDPMSGHFNAGSKGVFSLDHNYSYSYTSADWLPRFNLDDLYLNYSQLSAGWKLYEKQPDNPLEISGGIEVTRRFLNLGKTERRGENNEDLGSFESWENNYSYGVSIGFRYLAEVGIGYKLNYITSHLSEFSNIGNPEYDDEVNAKAYDWGILIRLPTNTVLKEGLHYDVSESIYPFLIDFIPSYGFSKSNLGGDEMYDDPLPEVHRSGYALEFRFDLPVVPLLGFIYAHDINRDRADLRSKEWIETSGVGREITFFDSFIYRWGNYYDTWGRASRSTTGFTFQSSGILKIIHLSSQHQEWAKGELYDFVMTRMNFKYSRSLFHAGEGQPLTDTEWIELGISF